MRILADMNLSPLWIPFLIQHGFEAVHWSDVGTASASDAELGGLVVNALNATRSHLVAGALVSVDAIQHRIRLLPIGPKLF